MESERPVDLGLRPTMAAVAAAALMVERLDAILPVTAEQLVEMVLVDPVADPEEPDRPTAGMAVVAAVAAAASAVLVALPQAALAGLMLR